MSLLSKIERAVRDGWVRKNAHPSLPLTIYTYTPQTQYEQHWTPITEMCRGLVLENETGKVVARPFSKFYNLSEHLSRGETLPDEPFEVTDKMDGSLGIAFWYGDRWHVATKGSFMSDQAMVATGLMQVLNMDAAPKDSTLLFEIIYPENRIVVDYGETTELVLIGGTTGDVDWDYTPVLELALQLGCKATPLLASGYAGFVPEDLPVRDNKEGYVVRFRSGLRLKIKHEEYVRLHAILTKVSSYTVWEYLRNGKPMDELKWAVPDEFYNWLLAMEIKIRGHYLRVLTAAYADSLHYRRDTRKETALAWKEGGMRTPSGIFFAALDGEDIRAKAWDHVKPEYELPFQTNGAKAKAA